MGDSSFRRHGLHTGPSARRAKVPWKEYNQMDERLKFIARLLDGEKMAVLCRQFGISRPWLFRNSPAQFRSPQTLPPVTTSGGRHGPTVDDVFGARNGARTRRGQKRNQVGHFFWLRGTAERDTAERVHHDLAGTFVVGGILARDLFDEADRSVRLDPAGRDPDDPNTFGAYLL